MKSIEIEEAVARMFGIRQNIIVPNICWGLNLHECDLLVVRKTGYAIEVEIKVSKADLKKDTFKRHGHKSGKIKELYFAVPEQLYNAAVEFAPADAGIIAIETVDTRGRYSNVVGAVDEKMAVIKRLALTNKSARPLSSEEVNTVARLGCMRIWGLKAKLIKQMKEPTNA